MKEAERKLAVRSTRDAGHSRSADDFAEAEDAVSQYGITEWGDRLVDVVRNHRRLQGTEGRPILFICHSTGGTVVKQALSRKAEAGEIDITRICLAVVFFATPHHGSSVLSQPEYVQTVRDNLGLKWEMSECLREEFTLRNPELESMNYKFAKSVVGTKIYSYVETVDTNLTVLSINDYEGEGITTVRLCITDSRSGKLSTAETPIEDEQVRQLSTTHVGAPKFVEEEASYARFLFEVGSLVENYSEDQRKAFQLLNQTIMSSVLVDIHTFYGDIGGIGGMKILSARPTLEEFLEMGPTQCMADRIRGSDQRQRQPDKALGLQKRAKTQISGAPAVTVTAADIDEIKGSTPLHDKTLSAPEIVLPKSIHTRRPSFTSKESDVANSPGHLAPAVKSTKNVQFSRSPLKDREQLRKPQRAPAFKLPTSSTDRFKWIHVPFNHSGWVPHVLTAISQDKEDLTLHSKLLLDKMWYLQHNRSRHASPHARFVKPSVRCLFPKGRQGHLDGLLSPTSAGDDIQFVLYMPYLHWDNFTAMQKRASVIKRRREQADARPVARDVAYGKSLEQKIIWQYLTSDRPVHCRRTLDQYGYPSLRNTIVRDGDQILYKRTRPNADAFLRAITGDRSQSVRMSMGPQSSLGLDGGSAKVLMVDQLWLWIIDSQTIITFFTSKEREERDDGVSRECDIRSTIYQDINGDYANQCADPFDFAALAVTHVIKALLEDAEDSNLQVFRIFEEYISILTERQTSSFKEFRNNHRFQKNMDIQASRHVDNRKDLDALLELRDIEDELNTIEKLIREQQSCVNDMLTQYRELNANHHKGLNGTNFLLDVLAFLSDHESQVREMLKSARTAQKAFKELLDMKQKQANVVEAHLAREQTEVATDQSRSVMIFTIFTIIFLPLSFFASVFGINAREWSGDGNNYLPLHQIFTYMGAISLAVIFIALLVAFSRHARRAVQKAWHTVAKPVLVVWRQKLLPHTQGNIEGDESNGLSPSNLHRLLRNYDLEKAHLSEQDYSRKRSSMISRTPSRVSFADQDGHEGQDWSTKHESFSASHL